MKPVVLVGYSGHGQVCARSILDLGYDLVGYCDTELKEHNPFNLPYLGTEHDWLLSKKDDTEFFIGIGDNKIRKRIGELLLDHSNPVSIIEQQGCHIAGGLISKHLVLVAMGASIQVGVKLGTGCIVNTSASIDHDCQIGDYTHIAPGAVLAGNVVVDDLAFIGANSTVLPGLQIGKGAILGAGSVLTKNLPAGEIWAGNPARPLKVNS